MAMPKVQTQGADDQPTLIQRWGEFGDLSWFFRARGRSWQFHLSTDKDRDATCASPHEDDFWLDELWNGEELMTADQASGLISNCIRRFWLDVAKRSWPRVVV